MHQFHLNKLLYMYCVEWIPGLGLSGPRLRVCVNIHIMEKGTTTRTEREMNNTNALWHKHKRTQSHTPVAGKLQLFSVHARSAVSFVSQKSPVTVLLLAALRTTDKRTNTLERFEHWYTTACVCVCVNERKRQRQETNKSLSALSAVGNKTILIL